MVPLATQAASDVQELELQGEALALVLKIATPLRLYLTILVVTRVSAAL